MQLLKTGDGARSSNALAALAQARRVVDMSTPPPSRFITLLGGAAAMRRSGRVRSTGDSFRPSVWSMP